jgi:hypothetical protein
LIEEEVRSFEGGGYKIAIYASYESLLHFPQRNLKSLIKEIVHCGKGNTLVYWAPLDAQLVDNKFYN